MSLPDVKAMFERMMRIPTLETLSVESLGALKDDELGVALIKHVSHVLQGLDGEASYDRLEQMPEALRDAYTAHVIDGEIRNGGFLQMFWNPIGLYGELAADGMRRLGAVERAAIVQEALERFMGLSQAGEYARMKGDGSIEAFSAAAKNDPFRALTDRYYEDASNVDALIVQAVRSKPAAFEHRPGPRHGV